MIDSHLVIVGMLAAILAAGFWVTLTTFYNLPVLYHSFYSGGGSWFWLVAAYHGIIPYSEIHWSGSG
jgi:PiT family inorganic phosphate transporter